MTEAESTSLSFGQRCRQTWTMFSDGVCDTPVEWFLRSFALKTPLPRLIQQCLYVPAHSNINIIEGQIGELIERDNLPPKSNPNHVRVVIISDTHECHNALGELPRGDLLLHCGDIGMSTRLRSERSALRTLKDFDAYMGRNSEPGRAVVIGGNHDLFLERLSKTELELHLPHVIVLNDTSIEICGLKIFGTGKSRGRSKNRAYQPPIGDETHLTKPQSPSTRHPPTTADIVMSHGPPVGSHLIRGAKLGCVYPSDNLPQAKQLHCFGHMHFAYGAHRYNTSSGLTHVCGSTMGGEYRPSNPPVIIDLEVAPITVPPHVQHSFTNTSKI
eukprot:m.79245 g.79245  ORF g.79245 m.79245 type:complete len:329 (-) comp25193_c0_seq1:45-1031(-)